MQGKSIQPNWDSPCIAKQNPTYEWHGESGIQCHRDIQPSRNWGGVPGAWLGGRMIRSAAVWVPTSRHGIKGFNDNKHLPSSQDPRSIPYMNSMIVHVRQQWNDYLHKTIS